MNPSPSGQRRLDEAFGESDEARVEAEYRHLRESRSSHAPLPYEERLVAWTAEREDAMEKSAARPMEPTPVPPARPVGAPGSPTSTTSDKS